eukprot:scaffold11299_cov67-Skeletonema_dohrnii-CCMP3373.AAC.1
MAHSLPDTNRGGPLPPDAEGNGANASGELAVAAAVSVGAHIYLAASLSLLIDSEASAAASSAEQEEASASSPPQQPPVDATTDDDNNDDDVGVVSVPCDFTNVNSINEFYPVQDGKSKMQINVFTLNKLETAEQKDRFCRSWRMCTNR